jgi:hypothetical protein
MQPMVSLRKRPLAVPEVGQRVRLRTARGRRWRGSYRAVSEPYTDEGGVVVLRVAEEEEYRAARREGRNAIGMPWPVGQMAVVLPPPSSEEATGELPTLRHQQRLEKSAQSGSAPPGPRPDGEEAHERPEGPWWRRVFGG